MKKITFFILVFMSTISYAEQDERSKTGIARQMSVTFSDLLWRYEPGLIEKTLKSSITNYRLQGALIFDEGLKEYHFAWNDHSGVAYQKSDFPFEIPDNQSISYIKQNIFHNEKKLGDLTVFFSSSDPVMSLTSPPVAAPAPMPAFMTPEQVAFLNRHSRFRVSINEYLPPYTFFESNEAKGYWVELMRLMFKNLDIELIFLPRNKSREFAQTLDQRQVDILTSILILPWREKEMRFSRAVVKFGYPAFIMKAQDTPVNYLDALSGRKVALVKDHPYERALSRTGVDYELKEAKTLQHALEMVSYGEAEATLQDNTVAAYFTGKLGLTNLRPTGAARFSEMSRQRAAFAVAKDRPLLQDLLNRLLNNVSPEDINALRKKWFFPRPEAARAKIPLSEDEKAWLMDQVSSGLELSYSIDPDWMPLERINDQGRHEGLTHDLILQLSERIGIPFRMIPTNSWSQTLELVRKGSSTLIVAAAETIARREYLQFTRPHTEYPLVVAVSNEELFIENLEAIRDKTLGVVKGYAHTDLIRQKYPNFKIVEVNNIYNGLKRVQAREIFGFVDTAPTIEYQLRRRGIEDLKIGGKLDIPLKLSIAMGKGAPAELLSILNKALDSFTEEDKQLLADK